MLARPAQYLGQDAPLEPEQRQLPLTEGDRVLLCTDGLTKHVSDERIARILSNESAESAGQSLIDAALEGGGTDNVTVVVAKALMGTGD